MLLRLTPLSEKLHGPDDKAYKGKVPLRARFLAPDAAKSLVSLEAIAPLIYTDVFRSAESSLLARQTKRGVQPPGYSAHNYGLAVDLDVDPILKLYGWKYTQLLTAVEQYGWFCHRRDGSRGAEDWHFNFLGPASATYLKLCKPTNAATWSAAIEARIVERYGPYFDLDDKSVQVSLAKLGFYKGVIDGKLGPLSAQSVAAFQRAWILEADGVAGPRTRRTLAYVAADTVLV